MIKKEHINNFLDLIPQDKVISYKQLADIFCVSMDQIYEIVWDHKQVIPKKDGENEQQFRIPNITNYYISLTTSNKDAIGYFEEISRKILLLHPGCVLKIPTYYHITLADLSNVPINEKLINDVFWETTWLQEFWFRCTLDKPYVDRKKNKVIFWVHIWHNPFLITLHQCIKKFVPRRAEKQFIPHITLGKILWNIEYNKDILDTELDIQCVFDELCIVANIDLHKDITLFSKKIS